MKIQRGAFSKSFWRNIDEFANIMNGKLPILIICYIKIMHSDPRFLRNSQHMFVKKLNKECN